MGKRSYDLSFLKLKGSSNWQQWECQMCYHLQAEELWEYIKESIPCPVLIHLSDKDQDDNVKLTQQEKQVAQIWTWHAEWQNCVSIILSWVSEDIAIDVEAKKVNQTNLDPVTNEVITSDYVSKWTSKKLWDFLMMRFTDQNSSKVWTALTALD